MKTCSSLRFVILFLMVLASNTLFGQKNQKGYPQMCMEPGVLEELEEGVEQLTLDGLRIPMKATSGNKISRGKKEYIVKLL